MLPILKLKLTCLKLCECSPLEHLVHPLPEFISMLGKKEHSGIFLWHFLVNPYQVCDLAPIILAIFETIVVLFLWFA